MAVVTLLSSIRTLPKPTVFTGLHSFQEKLAYLVLKKKKKIILKRNYCKIIQNTEIERIGYTEKFFNDIVKCKKKKIHIYKSDGWSWHF